VELSDEVAAWFDKLSPAGTAAARRIFTRLETEGPALGMPHSKPLGQGLRELRFACEDVARRITYTFDAERRAITLTTLHKQKSNERREILRARRALAVYRVTKKGQR
jgi:hypothetical protein